MDLVLKVIFTITRLLSNNFGIERLKINVRERESNQGLGWPLKTQLNWNMMTMMCCGVETWRWSFFESWVGKRKSNPTKLEINFHNARMPHDVWSLNLHHYISLTSHPPIQFLNFSPFFFFNYYLHFDFFIFLLLILSDVSEKTC